MMHLPRGDEYNAAVQNPRIVFTDTDLISSSVEETPLGLPKPYSGGFTITYKLSNLQKGWAVRCFHRDIQDLQLRYKAIGNFITKTRSQYFVEAKYLSEGIKVNGNGYPIIKMNWLEGEPLNIFLTKACSQKARIEKILDDFKNLIYELERFGIAHGDLQHGNIIVQNDKLFLIDYDGMYLPELASLTTNEIGHINYQHPKRSASHYNQNIDRFSSIVIYLGLKAISFNANLWKKYDNGENLLFKSQDFADFRNSDLIKDLSVIPEIKLLVERLIGCSHLDFDKVPSLKDFLSGNFIYDKSAVGTFSITRSQYEIIDASRKSDLLKHFGEKIEVVGKISGMHSGLNKDNSAYMFLNFGLYPNQTFTLIVWPEGMTALASKGISSTFLVGKYVSATGIIGSYGDKPQMTIDQVTQIQVLSGRKEAMERLKLTPSPISATTAVIKTADKEADIFNELYKDKQISTSFNPIVVSPPNIVHTPAQSIPNSIPLATKSTPINEGDNYNSCIISIVCAVVGAITIGSIFNSGFWFLGALGFGIIGTLIYDRFK